MKAARFRVPLLARLFQAAISCHCFNLTPLVEFTHAYCIIAYAADIRFIV